jgi:hypothetical protein
VIIKLKEGTRAKYAHIFFVCTGEEGMREALAFEGYQGCKILVQQYVAHYEQVYKIYGVGGDWYRFDIRKSLPQGKIANTAALKFDT